MSGANRNVEAFGDAVPSDCGASTGSSDNDTEAMDSPSPFWMAPTNLVDDYMAPPSTSVPHPSEFATSLATFVPHRGTLRRIHSLPSAVDEPRAQSSARSTSSKSMVTVETATTTTTHSAAQSFLYAISIAVLPCHEALPNNLSARTMELHYDKHNYDVMSQLFSILDFESRGSVDRDVVGDFVRLRCPVFRRRDRALRRYGRREEYGDGSSVTTSNDGQTNDGCDGETFNEVWDAVIECSTQPLLKGAKVELGLEGWMVFCRFVALAQYQEAKRQFSARHSQQTMRHKASASEVVLVDVPPPDVPASLSSRELAEHSASSSTPLLLPELDLDHCLISAHDKNTDKSIARSARRRRVEVKVFGKQGGSPGKLKSSNLDFVITNIPEDRNSNSNPGIVVRRNYSDLEWLYDTFIQHKSPGGTLCGRILPPFPSRPRGLGSVSSNTDGSSSTITGSVVAAGSSAANAAASAASAGAGMFVSVAKSAKTFLGGYVAPLSKKTSSPKNRSSSSESSKLTSGIRSRGSMGWKYGGDTPLDKAKQIERYLNYLLEHPALYTSFPLNVVLKASQSGQDSAKYILKVQAKDRERQRKEQQQVAQLDEEKPPSLLSPTFLSLVPCSSSMLEYQPNLVWVRSAAQAAMALKLHGILETTGMPSASAKLQHASLPNYSERKKEWGDEDDSPNSSNEKQANDFGVRDGRNFEDAVVNIASGLEADHTGEGDSEGYDLLPPPVPLSERSALCAGSADPIDEPAGMERGGVRVRNTQRPGYHYGSAELTDHDGADALLGDLSVDADIDRLREVIGSVDSILGQCLSASVRIGRTRRKENKLHLDVLRGIDSWEGHRGALVSQRALLSGVSVLEGGNDVSDECYESLKNNLSWQASLASAAVSAAEDVRSTVRASRTAARAKKATVDAAAAAQKASDTGSFTTPEESRAAKTRASIAHSHAIHSAVIEHEAMAAKRRAVMALAHDVKVWNIHRKRELLPLCRDFVHQQHEASQQSHLAWCQLRDGFIISSQASVIDVKGESHIGVHTMGGADLYGRPPESLSFTTSSSAPAQAHTNGPLDAVAKSVQDPSSPEEHIEIMEPVNTIESNVKDLCKSVGDKVSHGDGNGFAFEHNQTDHAAADNGDETVDGGSFNRGGNLLGEDYGTSDGSQASNDTEAGISEGDADLETQADADADASRQEHEEMTNSMQDLVDGLMNWGDQYDSQEDMSLPNGMAVSMILEESGVFENGKNSVSPDIL